MICVPFTGACSPVRLSRARSSSARHRGADSEGRSQPVSARSTLDPPSATSPAMTGYEGIPVKTTPTRDRSSAICRCPVPRPLEGTIPGRTNKASDRFNASEMLLLTSVRTRCRRRRRCDGGRGRLIGRRRRAGNGRRGGRGRRSRGGRQAAAPRRAEHPVAPGLGVRLSFGDRSAGGRTTPVCSGNGGRNTAWSSRRTSGAGSTARTCGRWATWFNASGAPRTTAAYTQEQPDRYAFASAAASRAPRA